MELHERLSTVRKALGMTQEQLGRRIGVSGAMVAQWESGEVIPDAVSIGIMCRELNLSADYVLLGKEPGEAGAVSYPVEKEDSEYDLPEVCPCCGRPVSGSLCPTCGYPLPMHPPRGPRYAVVSTCYSPGSWKERVEALVKYCGLSREDAEAIVSKNGGSVLRRDLPDGAARWIAQNLHQTEAPKVVEDLGEPAEVLAEKDKAMELAPAEKGGLGFWGVVGAVIVALVILSFL